MAECPKCGFIMDELDRECRRCHHVPGQATPATPTVVAGAAAPTAPAAQGGAACPHCGAPLPTAMARICPSCRASLVKGSAPASISTATAARVTQQTYAGVDESNNRTVLIIGGSLSALVLVAYLIFAFTRPKPDLGDAFGNMTMKPGAMSTSPSGDSDEGFLRSAPAPLPEKDFTRTGERLEKRDGKYYIVGKLKNNSSTSYKYVMLEYEMLKEAGGTVTYISSTISNVGAGTEVSYDIATFSDKVASFKFVGIRPPAR